MKKQKLKLNAKLSFDNDIVSTLNKDGLSQIVGGMVQSTKACSDINVICGVHSDVGCFTFDCRF